MGKVLRHNVRETMGEMRLLNLRLKVQLTSKPLKSETESALYKMMANPKYQVYMVGIENDPVDRSRGEFTLAIFKPSDDGLQVVDRYLQVKSQQDLTHFEISPEFSRFEELPHAVQKEINEVYEAKFTLEISDSEEYLAEEPVSEEGEGEGEARGAHM
jgi:hypothetical protein